jgi:RNA polymerase sigma factor (sigma-70 family)
MTNGQVGRSLRQLRELAGAAALSDAELLQEYVRHHDPSALAALVHRHGPLVMGVCRRVLRHAPDVEDAFQATFLVLARKAGAVRRGESLASWLYGVARRVAVRARVSRSRREYRERPLIDMARDGSRPTEEHRELQRLLDEELQGLPEKYRAPLILHYLVGQTKAETARCLGWSEGTVSGRLARGRKLLKARLSRRGLALGGGLAAVLETARSASAVPARLEDTALAAALKYAGGGTVDDLVSERATRLAHGVARCLGSTSGRFILGLVVSLAVLACGTAWLVARHVPVAPEAPLAPPPRAQAAPRFVPREAEPSNAPQAGVAFVRLGAPRARQPGPINALRFSGDGKLLATLGRDSLVRVWDAKDGKQLHVLRGDGETALAGFWCLAFAPDGKTLATGGGDGLVRFWDPRTGKQLRQFRGNEVGVRSLAFAAAGKLLAIAGEDNGLGLWDPETCQELECPIVPSYQSGRTDLLLTPVRQVVLSPDGKTVGLTRVHMTGGLNYDPRQANGGGIKLKMNNPYDPWPYQTFDFWDVATGRKRGRFEVMADTPAPVFSADGKTLVWTDRVKNLSLRSVDGGGEIRRFSQSGIASPSALSPDGKTLALAERTGIRLWEVNTGTEGRSIPDAGQVTSLTFARDGRTLAAGRYNGSYDLWDTATGKILLPPSTGHDGYVFGMAYSPDGKTLATCGLDNTVRLWRVSLGKEIRRWGYRPVNEAEGIGPRALAFTPDGKVLLGTGAERAMRRWEIETGNELDRVVAEGEPKAFPVTLAWSPEGGYLAKRYAGFVRLWTSAGREVPLAQQVGPVVPGNVFNGGLVFSRDGKYLAGWQRGAVRLWKTNDGSEVKQIAALPGEVSALAFSPDGAALASAGSGEEVWLWDVATGVVRHKLAAPAVALPDRLDPVANRMTDRKTGAFAALAFSADGKALFGGRYESGSLYVWDLAPGRPVRMVPGHQETISSLATSSDGKSLASASADGAVLVWDVNRLTATER